MGCNSPSEVKISNKEMTQHHSEVMFWSYPCQADSNKKEWLIKQPGIYIPYK